MLVSASKGLANAQQLETIKINLLQRLSSLILRSWLLFIDPFFLLTPSSGFPATLKWVERVAGTSFKSFELRDLLNALESESERYSLVLVLVVFEVLL